LRNVADLLRERCIDAAHETVRFWWNRFGTIFAAEIRRNRVQAMRHFQHRRWHLDEVFVTINGVKHYLWRAVDHEGEVLESYVTKTRDKVAALKFLRKSLRQHVQTKGFVTDRLDSYGAALKALGAIGNPEVGRWLNNRTENNHQPFRRRERAMFRFRRIRRLQKLAAVHGQVHNQFASRPFGSTRNAHSSAAGISRIDVPLRWPHGVNSARTEQGWVGADSETILVRLTAPSSLPQGIPQGGPIQ
jgi:putative transposase